MMAGRPKAFDRDQVLDRALEVFWTGGYEATSLGDLTEAMDLRRGSLYHEFGDKHTLFLAALDRYRAERLAQLTGALTAAPSVRAGVAAALGGTVDLLWADGRRRGCLLVNSTTELAGSDPAVAARAAESFERVAAVFASALERGRHTGELDQGTDVRALSRFLTATLYSLRLLARTSDRQVAEDVVRVALQTLGQPEGRT
jgi:TetR/AcrR family transcriptional regulator, transcriptional repressor for nem operon